MSKWIRNGDKVVVTAGNEKGKTGVVLSRTPKRIVVEGLNMRKKHCKPTQENPKGQILKMEGSMHISNVSLCNDEGKAIRVRVHLDGKGKKELVHREGDKDVTFRTVCKG